MCVAADRVCNPSPMAFRLLPPNASFTATSRLHELCPPHTFDRIGNYLVHAYYDATESGAQWGYSAFTGRIFSQQPALVRVLSGGARPDAARRILRLRDH